MPSLQNFIDGEIIAPVGQAWMENLSPRTGATLGYLADSDERDVSLAVEAAKKAFPAWSTISPADRAAYLEAIADAIAERLEEFAIAESEDQGKPRTLAKRVDIPRAVDNFRFFAQAITQDQQECFDPGPGKFHYQKRQPIGVAGLISPWNLPLYLLTWKIAPALACGNTIVAKPSEFTSTTAHMLAEILTQVNLPKGVCNIVLGKGPKVGEALVTHPDVPLISFTGSSATASQISKSAAPFHKKLSLELGGKNPALIFDDCDIDQAVACSIRSSFTNQGEICLCSSRLLIADTIYDEFTAKFTDAAGKLILGDPRQPDTFMGPLVSRQHFNKVASMVTRARSQGSRCLIGGEPVTLESPLDGGYFYPPTVLETQQTDLEIMQEEVFGPVVTLTRFSDEAEAVRIANGVRYGLAATVFTNNLARSQRVADQLQSGLIWVNCWMERDLRVAFGGQKHSGVGREGGRHSIDFYTESKSICLSY
jgi:aminomuconate-semialdehyde/2-hydroxymuconate-6-semialdehyde dehydrogenase